MGRRKKVPCFVKADTSEFHTMTEQGFEPAYVQVGGVRITSHKLGQLHVAGGKPPKHQPRQWQQSRVVKAPDSSSEGDDGGDGCSSDALDEHLQDYLENVVGTGGGSQRRGRPQNAARTSRHGLGLYHRGKALGDGSLPVGIRYPGESSGAELRVPVCGDSISAHVLEEDFNGESDEEEEGAELCVNHGSDDDDDRLEGPEDGNVQGTGEDDDEDSSDSDEEDEEDDMEDMRGDTAMLRRLLAGFAGRDLDDAQGEEQEGIEENQYEALFAGSPRSNSSRNSEEYGENDCAGLPYGRRIGRGPLRPLSESMGYYYEYRYDNDDKGVLVVVEEPAEAGGRTEQPLYPGSDTRKGNLTACGGHGDEADRTEELGRREDVGLEAVFPSSSGWAAAVNRFPFTMKSREEVRAAADAAVARAMGAAAYMASSASGGATPAAPRSSRNRHAQQREQQLWAAPPPRSSVKGAHGGALRPGEKHQLKTEKMQAKRAAREAVRGFNVGQVAERIADFVSGEGDVLALDPLGTYGTAVAQSLAGVYGLKHTLQGARKRKFLLLQPTDRTKAPDELTRIKVDKIVAVELDRQRRGAAAGAGVGEAGMALNDVTPASVAAARRGGRANGGRGALAAVKSSSQGYARGSAGSYNLPVAFVRSGVHRDGAPSPQLPEEREPSTPQHLCSEGNEDHVAEGADCRDGGELVGGPAEGMWAPEPEVAPTLANCFNRSSNRTRTSTSMRSGSTDSVRENAATAIREEAIDEAEEAEAEEGHQGLGFVDAHHEWLPVAFGGLGFQSCTHEQGFLVSDKITEDEHNEQGAAAGSPPWNPKPKPLLSNRGGGAGAGVNGPTGSASAAGNENTRLVVSPDGVTYFRTQFCLGPGYDAEERHLQPGAAGEVLEHGCRGGAVGIGFASLLGKTARTRLDEMKEQDMETGEKTNAGTDSASDVADASELALATGMGAELLPGHDDECECQWRKDKHRGNQHKNGRAAADSAVKGKAVGMGATKGLALDTVLAVTAGEELGRTAQQSKTAGKKAAKEERRKRRQRQQQQQQGILPPQPDSEALLPGPYSKMVAPADQGYEFGSFERHGTSIGSRLMARMGWTQGEGLGRTRQGQSEPVRAAIRPRGLGLGADV